MEYRIKYIDYVNNGSLKDFNPEKNDNFSIELEIEIELSHKNDIKNAIFLIEVASPKGLIKSIQKNFVLLGQEKLLIDKRIIMERYNYQVLMDFINQIIAKSMSKSILATFLKISRSFYWGELEDFPDSFEVIIERLKQEPSSGLSQE